MSVANARAWAWTQVAVTLALVAVGGFFLVATRDVTMPDVWGFRGYPGLLAVPFSIVGALLVSQRAENPIGWIFSAIAVLSGVQLVAEELPIYADTKGAFVAAATWVGHWIWFPIGALLAVAVLFFPTGRLPSRRWAKVLWTNVGIATLGVAAFVIGPASAMDVSGRNPLELEALAGVTGIVVLVVLLCFPLMLGVAALSLVTRMRGSTGDERQQLKWFLLGAALVPFAGVVPSLPVPSPIQIVFVCCFMGIPVVTGIAILKYRLYDIDIVINRTLVYSALTAFLGACYVVLVFGFEALLSPFTAESDLAIAASTLAVAALFGPARARVQRFIDRRFYRQKFDAERTIAEFSDRLRNEVELAAVKTQLTGVVAETMQPAHVSLWMRA